jgi:glycosyltransferase involved in cell wall biosynthesis
MAENMIVVSAVSLVDGGPLTVLRDCIKMFAAQSSRKEIRFLVSSPDVHEGIDVGCIEFYYFPNVKRSWFRRLYFEYVHANKLSKLWGGVGVWFSLHDMTPRVKAVKKFVYCHNPSPMVKIPLKDILIDPKQYFFSKFYEFLYRINLKDNDAIIVQQQWFAAYFSKLVKGVRVVVSNPDVNWIELGEAEGFKSNKVKQLFYPAYPRYFKNHARLISGLRDNSSIELLLTLSGSENSVARKAIQLSAGSKNISFLGVMTHDRVMSILRSVDALIFPSLIETWGLPLTEAKLMNVTVLAADLEYAHEALGEYERVYWFDPYSERSINNAVERFLADEPFDCSRPIEGVFETRHGWGSVAQFVCSGGEQ